MNTAWTVEITAAAKKRLLRMPADDRLRLWKGIGKLKDGPHQQDVDIKPLKGRSEWRLRIGGWRVLFGFDESSRKIVVLSVDTRGDVYK